MDRADVAAALDAMRYTTAQSAQVGTCVLGPLTKTVFVVADDHDTVVELCRQQHEFIKMVRDYYLNLHPEATEKADVLLALWPDGGE